MAFCHRLPASLLRDQLASNAFPTGMNVPCTPGGAWSSATPSALYTIIIMRSKACARSAELSEAVNWFMALPNSTEKVTSTSLINAFA